jgi:hypothetical protein
MRGEVIAIVLAILVTASLGVGYLAGSSARGTQTITSTTTSTSTVTSVFTHGILVPVSSASTLNSLTGLSLNLNLSTNANGQVVVTAYEFNTLDRLNNASSGSNSLNVSFFQWTKTNCDDGGMEGYEILQGHYGSNNFTEGKALWLQPQREGLNCVGPLDGGNSSYSFKPLSAENVLLGSYVGYWSGPMLADETPSYTPFAPGTYTVVAGDQWGQVAILRFIVAG